MVAEATAGAETMSGLSMRRLDRCDARDVAQWKALIAEADGATVFHDPEFLSYHADRFDEHHIGCFKGDTLWGMLPMAIEESEGRRVSRSPYGGSVGGWVFRSAPDFAAADAAADAFLAYLSTLGVARITVTPPVAPCYERPSDTFQFCLLRRGFRLVNSDVLSVVRLGADLEATVFNARARRMRRKAERLGVTYRSRAPLEDFWPLVEATFARHQARPTHSREEWAWLMAHMPDDVWVDVAYLDERPAAGVGHIRIGASIDSSFYLCLDPEMRDTQALSFAVYDALLGAADAGYKWFDFGGSTVNMVPRESIFQFKENFGAVGVFRHTYELELT